MVSRDEILIFLLHPQYRGMSRILGSKSLASLQERLNWRHSNP
jgi:hypothetical protein